MAPPRPLPAGAGRGAAGAPDRLPDLGPAGRRRRQRGGHLPRPHRLGRRRPLVDPHVRAWEGLRPRSRLRRLLQPAGELLRDHRPRLDATRPPGPRTAARFPEITIRDMVEAQHALVRALGVRRVRMVIGGSLGGMQALEWALLHPELVESLAFIASTARHSAWAIGLSEAQRQAIFADPRWRGGDYLLEDPPSAGLAAARMQAMLTYRSAPSFEERFGRRPQAEDLFAIESYLRYQGQQLVDRFDAATYVTLTKAMDTHDVTRGRGDLDEVLHAIRQPTLVVSIDSDVLYWPSEQREVARLVPGARFAILDSPQGHDAFLIDVERLSDLVAEFRGGAGGAAGAGRAAGPRLPGARRLPAGGRQGQGGRGAAGAAAGAADRAGAGLRRGAAGGRAGRPARRPAGRGGGGPRRLARAAGGRRRGRAARRPDRPGAARPAGPAAPPDPGGRDRGRGNGRGLRAGLPARHRRRRLQQAAADGLGAAARRRPGGPAAARTSLELRRLGGGQPAGARHAAPADPGRGPGDAGGGLPLLHRRLHLRRAVPRDPALHGAPLGHGARPHRGGPPRRPLRRRLGPQAAGAGARAGRGGGAGRRAHRRRSCRRSCWSAAAPRR